MTFPFEQQFNQKYLEAQGVAPDPELKKNEEKQLITLIEQDQLTGVIDSSEATQLRSLAHQGRLIAYAATEDGPFDGYISKDEWTQVMSDPHAAATQIHLMNPLWGKGKPVVTLGELGTCFDTKEMVTLVDHLELNGIQIDNLQYDEANRMVMGDVKSGQGKFHFRVNLDDGTHEPPVYEFADQEGQIVRVLEDGLGKITDINQGMDIRALRERVESMQGESSDQPTHGSGGASKGHLNKLNNDLGLTISLKMKPGGDDPQLSPDLAKFIKSIGSHSPRAANQSYGGISTGNPTINATPSLSPSPLPKIRASKPAATPPPSPKTAPPKAEQPPQTSEPQGPQKAPSRFTGAPLMRKKKGMKGKIAAAAGLTAAGALGIPSGVGIWSMFINPSSSTAMLPDTLHHFLSLIA